MKGINYTPGLITRIKYKVRRLLEGIRYRIKLPRVQLSNRPKLPRFPRISFSPKAIKKFWQSGLSILLFFLVLGLFQLEYQWAKSMQNQVRATFSAQRDFSPQIKEYLTFGWWLNSYDRMAFTNHANREAVPVISVRSGDMSVPVSGKVVKRFGLSKGPDGQERFYEGIAIEAPLGSPIVAVQEGTVIRVTDDPILGRLVQIDHGQGLFSLYAHCSEILVKEGQEVKQNQVIAKVGLTGKVTTPTLHFELREQGRLVDPLTMLKSGSPSI